MIYDNNEITAITYSGYNIVRAYSCGGELVFGDEPTPPVPPVFEGKFKLTLNDSSTVSAECSTSSTVTQAEISAYKATTVSAEIGDCVTAIGFMSFQSCTGLTSITLPNSLTTIGTDGFSYCYNLTSVNIPNSVTFIGQHAFRYCSFTTITIPDSVATIAGQAFQYCSGLTSVTVNATTPPTLGNSAFDSTNDCPIYVPAASLSAYQSASGWSEYASRLQAMP